MELETDTDLSRDSTLEKESQGCRQKAINYACILHTGRQKGGWLPVRLFGSFRVCL